ncbi:Spondin-2 [Geodia barretti]|uniref:Spondin-2 n=1 Tax=Geodia barretti TaxID=519541 RepID=A0AA35TIE2_GEOBA|nr:Spondin-2 [Geodia barretti]
MEPSGNKRSRSASSCSQTATASDKVVDPMERNSVQANNCSFGYVSFILKPEDEPRSEVDETCEPLVPKECLGRISDTECPSCCCESTDNVEFYDPNFPEPECTAVPAYYNVDFVFTWSGVCHPDYYFPNESKWSPPTAVSHNTQYRMWDACMDNASPGVGLVSQTGGTSVIDQEYVLAGDNIYGMVEGDLVPTGSGRTYRKLKIDKSHQFVSGVSMLVPSPDRLVGVADLRLCDGDQWKREVQVCFELFSTATATAKVAPEMERNSVQENNCSFGYVRFTLEPQEEPRSGETRFEVAETCEPLVPKECPGRISQCSSCCCESSENVEFYEPSFPEPECTAVPAYYNVDFVFTWSGVCHPDYYFPNESKWSPPTVVSHNTQYRMWDACMDNASPGVGLVSRTGGTSVIDQEYVLAGDSIYGMVEGDLVPTGSGRTYRKLKIDKYHQFVSGVSMLVPSPDRLVGVADLRLCDGDQWKREVQVCFELFSTATATAKVAPEMERNSVQENNCSFGYVRFTLEPQEEPRSGETRFEVAETCEPLVPKKCPGRINESQCSTCCCESTENVEFYDPTFPEPECTADPASYNISFVFTWSVPCHPDYYFPGESIWSPPTAVSHNTQYRMWDACMDNASPGVGLVSRTGNTSIINQEYALAGDNISNITEGDLVRPGSGMTSRIMMVDNKHQFVSAVSMLVPSPDRLVGVADLRLCDGDQWKREVQVCFELFSTATASNRASPEMQRNSFQANNCSFGYVRLILNAGSPSITSLPLAFLSALGVLVAAILSL